MCTLGRVFSCWSVCLVYNGNKSMFVRAPWMEVFMEAVILFEHSRVQNVKKENQLSNV